MPPPIFLADHEVEKTKYTEEMEPIALHYDISDTTPYVSKTKEEKFMLSQSEPEPEPHSDASRGPVIIHTPEASLFEVIRQKTPDDPIPFENQGGLPLISHYICHSELGALTWLKQVNYCFLCGFSNSRTVSL